MKIYPGAGKTTSRNLLIMGISKFFSVGKIGRQT
jgi:hypothetical protein